MSHFTGEMGQELAKLVDAETIRILDLIVLVKDDNGNVDAIEIDDLDEVDELRAAETQLADLLAAEDVIDLGAAMEPGTTAGVLVWENAWAAPFASAARRRAANSSPTVESRSRPSSPRSRPTKKETDMPLGPRRMGRRGVIGGPVARTAAVAGTAAVVAHGVGRRRDRRDDRQDDRGDRRDDRRDRR